MKSAVCGADSITWDTFKYIAADMVPRTLHDKIDLFLEAFTPQDLSIEEKDFYEFTQDEIHYICASCLAVIFARTDDNFFQEISINFAKIIYQIVGIKWIDDPEKPQNTI